LPWRSTSSLDANGTGACGLRHQGTVGVTGHPDFERLFRVQMNTLEWMPLFLPSLWLFAISAGASAPALDAIWIVGRILWWNGYRQAAKKVQHGICDPQALACFALWLGALGAIV